MFWRRKSSQPPAAAPEPAVIERKTDSLRPGCEPEPLDPGEVTGVIDLALERLRAAQEATTSALEDSARKLQAEAERARRLARSVRPEKS
jgi:hypothetical protein